MSLDPLMMTNVYRRLGQFGLLLGACGAFVIAWGAYSFLKSGDAGRRRERRLTLTGSLLITVAFILMLVSVVRAPGPESGQSPTPTVSTGP